MPVMIINTDERGEFENMGSGTRFQFLPFAAINTFPTYYNGKLYGAFALDPAADIYEFVLPTQPLDFDGKRDIKGNNDTYMYELVAMVPINELSTLSLLEAISNTRGVVLFFPNNENGARLLGSADVAAYLKYNEDYGKDQAQLNCYKISIACEMPYPAGFLL